MPDFRASERTYALRVELAGRAGRGDVPGRVLVQTWKVDHEALQDLDDVEAFLERELRHRRVLRYPPWSRLVLVGLDGPDRAVVNGAAAALSHDLRARARAFPGVDVLGHAAAALPRLVGRWRFQIVLRGLEVRPFRAFLADVERRIGATAGKGVRVHVDVDPRQLM
jgi:primosomal protein N' (replication factor Y)